MAYRSPKGPSIDTSMYQGEFVFNILTAVTDLERQQIIQHAKANMDYVKRHDTKSDNAIICPASSSSTK